MRDDQRNLLFAIGAVLAILLAIALTGWLTGGWNVGSEDYYRVASADEALTVSEFDERIIMLDREALDDAYRAKISQLFSVWMKDDTGQPARAITGANQARKAYIDVMKAINQREKKLRTLRELNQ